jgi:hypothetical protein
MSNARPSNLGLMDSFWGPGEIAPLHQNLPALLALGIRSGRSAQQAQKHHKMYPPRGGSACQEAGKVPVKVRA